MIGKTISHYKILEKLGSGGMGVVYRAEDTQLRRTVALKFLPAELTRDAEAKERFIREARAASALDHANICTIYEINESGGQTFIAMAYVEGDSLQSRIESGPLDLVEAVNIVMQIARGLEEAHEKGIVHRDIKPANVMITPKGQVKIMDFGLAKLVGAREITEKEVTPGTIAYMSPEQTHGDEVDRRTDIWSLGVVLYELITGKRPFRGDYHQAIIYSILNEEAQPAASLRPEIPKELERIVSKAMKKNPDRRYQRSDELIADLLQVKGQLRTDAVPPRRRPKRFSWARILLFASPFMVLVVLVAVLFISKKGPRSPISGIRQAATKWQNSIAVLPFRDFSPGKDQEYFCDGMTEAIIGKLSGLPGLKVISMTSAMRYKSPQRDIGRIGEELDVATILEGSVQKEGSRIRVRTQLINVADDTHLWNQTYDRELASVFAIQDEISQAIVDVMKIKLLGDEWSGFVKRHTENIDAYNAYVQGRFLWNKRTEENLMKAIEYFEKAIELDPNYAQAYAGLADVYAVMPSNIGYPQEEAIPKVRRSAIFQGTLEM